MGYIVIVFIGMCIGYFYASMRHQRMHDELRLEVVELRERCRALEALVDGAGGKAPQA
ncbi:hypothetical protein [Candidimonas sp. SYP-B2681]|uniref:hypothetical protein n=1 Tax=Candidimonas sp. SYP-B2681 TaxID=2497686 RepID=UPI00131570A1|nr:hypothetical protein [Candidimonas sp. SYP-B2681]